MFLLFVHNTCPILVLCLGSTQNNENPFLSALKSFKTKWLKPAPSCFITIRHTNTYGHIQTISCMCEPPLHPINFSNHHAHALTHTHTHIHTHTHKHTHKPPYVNIATLATTYKHTSLAHVCSIVYAHMHTNHWALFSCLQPISALQLNTADTRIPPCRPHCCERIRTGSDTKHLHGLTLTLKLSSPCIYNQQPPGELDVVCCAQHDVRRVLCGAKSVWVLPCVAVSNAHWVPELVPREMWTCLCWSDVCVACAVACTWLQTACRWNQGVVMGLMKFVILFFYLHITQHQKLPASWSCACFTEMFDGDDLDACFTVVFHGDDWMHVSQIFHGGVLQQ